MNHLKEYKAEIIALLLLITLILFRSIGVNHFERDAEKWAEPSVQRSNLILPKQAAVLTGEKLLIRLGAGPTEAEGFAVKTITIAPDSLFSKKILTKIRKNKGPVILSSPETAVGARAWMILSQMGYRYIFLLSSDPETETFTHEFRPETIVKPEL